MLAHGFKTTHGFDTLGQIAAGQTGHPEPKLFRHRAHHPRPCVTGLGLGCHRVAGADAKSPGALRAEDTCSHCRASFEIPAVLASDVL